jgi:hypothetical protein
MGIGCTGPQGVGTHLGEGNSLDKRRAGVVGSIGLGVGSIGLGVGSTRVVRVVGRILLVAGMGRVAGQAHLRRALALDLLEAG